MYAVCDHFPEYKHLTHYQTVTDQKRTYKLLLATFIVPI